MARDARYRLRLPEVTLESFEGESIVIDFASGCYYSLSASASTMLAALVRGESEAETLARMAARHPEAATRLAGDFDALLGRLLAERILLARDGAPPAPEAGPPEPVLTYEPPVLERFEDMREMLLLDPIHEIDQAAWGAAPSPGVDPGPA